MASKTQLQMTKNPFLSEIDETSFFCFSSMQQRIEMLKRLFKGKSRLVVVLGDRGSGKTLMLKQFLACEESFWKTCRINAHNPMDAENDSKLVRMKEHRAFIYQSEEMPSIMMDDAHTLTSTELLFLIQMTGVRGYARQIDKLVLFCEPVILQALSDLAGLIPEEGTVEKIYMGALARDEVDEYLLRRFIAAGYAGKNPFSSTDVDRLYQASGGRPGVLNEEADMLLKKKMSEDTKLPSFVRKIFSK